MMMRRRRRRKRWRRRRTLRRRGRQPGQAGGGGNPARCQIVPPPLLAAFVGEPPTSLWDPPRAWIDLRSRSKWPCSVRQRREVVDVGDVLDPCEDVWRQWRTLGPSVLSRVQNHRLQVWQMDEALCVWLGVHVHVVDDVEAAGNVDLPLLGVVLTLLLLLPGVGRGKGKLGMLRQMLPR